MASIILEMNLGFQTFTTFYSDSETQTTICMNEYFLLYFEHLFIAVLFYILASAMLQRTLIVFSQRLAHSNSINLVGPMMQLDLMVCHFIIPSSEMNTSIINFTI